MYINTSIQKAIYKLLCDETLFKIGYVGSSLEIAEKVSPIILSISQFKHRNFDYVYHNVCQVLQTRNNCVRNTNRKDYIKHNAIIRDISSVRISNKGRNGISLYAIGCFYKNFRPSI